MAPQPHKVDVDDISCLSELTTLLLFKQITVMTNVSNQPDYWVEQCNVQSLVDM